MYLSLLFARSFSFFLGGGDSVIVFGHRALVVMFKIKTAFVSSFPGIASKLFVAANVVILVKHKHGSGGGVG